MGAKESEEKEEAGCLAEEQFLSLEPPLGGPRHSSSLGVVSGSKDATITRPLSHTSSMFSLLCNRFS